MNMDTDTQHTLAVRVLRAIRVEWKPLLTLAVLTILFFYKFFFFGYLYSGADILNHWYHPWAARPDLRQPLPQHEAARKLLLLGEKIGIAPVISRPGNPEISDPVFSIIPAVEYSVKQMKNGELPLWNPTVLGGLNTWGDAVFSPFYPLNAIYFVPGMSVLAASTIKIILSVYLMGVFFFFLLRDMKMSRLAATAAALTLMFCSQTSAFLEYLSFMDAYMWMPLLFLLYRQYLRERQWAIPILGALAVCAICLSRNPKPISYILAFLAAYMLLHVFLLKEFGASIGEKAKRTVSFASVAFIFGVGLSAVLTVPMLAAIENTKRFHEAGLNVFLNPVSLVKSIWSSLNDALYLKRVINAQGQTFFSVFLPKLFGATADNKIWSPLPYVEFSASYLGITQLAFALWACIQRRMGGEIRFFFISAVFLFLSFLWLPPFYQLFIFLIPSSGFPRVLFLWSFCICVLFAFAIDTLGQRKGAASATAIQKLVRSWFPLALGGTSLLLLASFVLQSSWFYDLCAQTGYFGVRTYAAGVAQSGGQVSLINFTMPEFNVYHAFNFAVILLFCLLTIPWLISPTRIRRHKRLFLALLFVQLAWITININPTISGRYAYIPSHTTTFLKHHAGDLRVAGYGANNMFPAGVGSMYGVNDAMVRSCSIAPGRIFDLYKAIDPASTTHDITGVVPFTNTEILKLRVLDAMGIKYILASSPIKELKRQKGGREEQYDFTKHFRDAMVEQAGPNFVVPGIFSVRDKTYSGILANPPASLRYRLRVPVRGRLEFGIMIDPEAWRTKQPGDGVRFEVWLGEAGGQQRRGYAREIDPKSVWEHRKVFWESLDLASLANREIEVEFRTESLADPLADWARWVFPVITKPKQLSAATPADGLERYRLVSSAESVYVYENQGVLPRAFLSYGVKSVLPSEGQQAKLRGWMAFLNSRPAQALPGGKSQRNAILKKIVSKDYDPRQFVVLEGGKTLPNVEALPIKPVKYQMKKNWLYEYDVKAEQECYLYVADLYDPGWSAEIDGRPAEILRANYTYRAVHVPAGEHKVTMTFTPRGYTTGWLISILSLGMLVILAAGSAWRRRAVSAKRRDGHKSRG